VTDSPSTEDVAKLFEDGKMPSGDDFRTLITSMTSRKDFDASQQTFKEWTERGTLQFGPAGAGWTVQVSPAGELSFAPVGPNAPRKNASADLYGFARSFGRIGAFDSADALAGTKPLIDQGRLLSAPANGQWNTIVNMPAGLAAFEIVAATEQRNPPKVGAIQRTARWALGIEPPGPQILHAIATASAPDAEPRIERTTPSRFVRLLRGAAATVLLLLAVWVCVQSGGEFVAAAGKTYQNFIPPKTAATATPTPTTTPTPTPTPATTRTSTSTPAAGKTESSVVDLARWPSAETVKAAILVVLLVVAALFVVRIVDAYLSGIKLRWVKTSGAASTADRKCELKIKAPKDINAPDAKIYYHITVLWG